VRQSKNRPGQSLRLKPRTAQIEPICLLVPRGRRRWPGLKTLHPLMSGQRVSLECEGRHGIAPNVCAAQATYTKVGARTPHGRWTKTTQGDETVSPRARTDGAKK
jgi:hypothetical protein